MIGYLLRNLDAASGLERLRPWLCGRRPALRVLRLSMTSCQHPVANHAKAIARLTFSLVSGVITLVSDSSNEAKSGSCISLASIWALRAA